MIICFEGLDKSGKTTLATTIAKELGLNYFRSTKQIDSNINLEEAIRHDWRFLIDYISQVPQGVVFDRTFISQWVYSYAFRQDSILKNYASFDDYDKVFIHYLNRLELTGTPIYYFHCNRQNYVGVTDDKLDNLEQHSEKIKNLYYTFYEKFWLYPVYLDFECGIDNNLATINNEIRGAV